ncbi:MAG: flagellar basal body P-ring protein FlgI [Planctomycetota bacterium]
MKIFSSIYVFFLMSAVFFWGCSPKPEPPEPGKPLNPRGTIGTVAKYYATQATPIRGIGIVACLAGTGSSECPPEIRDELEKYIWQQVPEAGSVNPRLVIESQDTAVVEITGVIPALSTPIDRFDVILKPLSSTQTTSLDGGCLYTADLKEMSRLSSVEQFTRFSKTLAIAEGPVYTLQTDTSSPAQWRVLGGGRAKQSSSVRLILDTSNFTVASVIRNRINERFGPKTAVCVSAVEITLSFPAKYIDQREKFLGIVESLMLGSNPEMQGEYAQSLIEQILSKTDSERAEIALEGIGKSALDPLAPLLDHADPVIRFHAARCMLNIGDKRALPVLRAIVQDKNSPYRMDTVRAVGLSAKRRDAMPILETALNDSNMQIRLEAYEMLASLNSHVISRRSISNGAFTIDSVICSGPKTIYVYRQGMPRIVLFGSPLRCEKNIFIQSKKSSVTINSLPEDNRISVSRKHPNQPRMIGPVVSSNDLGVLIQTLGELPDIQSNSAARPGLAIPYAEILQILETMSEQEAVLAQFIAGPQAELMPVLEELPSNGRQLNKEDVSISTSDN